MIENEYNPKGNSEEKEQVEKKSIVRSKKEPTQKKERQTGKKLFDRIDKKRVRLIVGASLILVSFYIFLACLSYLFTWTEDQDRVMGKSLIYLFFAGLDYPLLDSL
jgi:hypothetical protein